jgi:hypothetical protein
MNTKATKIVYWSLTILFAAAMFMDGIAGIMRVEEGKEVLRHLGYPEYIMSIFGVAKISGVIAILQAKYQTIKEWAYAGFAINFIGAAASRAYAGDGLALIIPPIVVLAFMFVLYFLGKRVAHARTEKSMQLSF